MDGTLSLPGAAVIVDAEVERVRREHHEDFLYFHLCVARDSARALERMQFATHEYALKFRERERALAQASKHYLRLLDIGGLPPLLDSMVLAEGGLTP